jgi:hypothetical protein
MCNECRHIMPSGVKCHAPALSGKLSSGRAGGFMVGGPSKGPVKWRSMQAAASPAP